MRHILVLFAIILFMISSCFIGLKNSAYGPFDMYDAFSKDHTSIRIFIQNYIPMDYVMSDVVVRDSALDYGLAFSHSKVPIDTSNNSVTIGIVPVAITFNLRGVSTINFTPAILSSIFSGEIRFWNNYELQRMNPSVRLPDIPILILHSSPLAGEFSIFYDYLFQSTGLEVRSPVPGLRSFSKQDRLRQFLSRQGALSVFTLGTAKINSLSIAYIQNQQKELIYPNRTNSLDNILNNSRSAYPIVGYLNVSFKPSFSKKIKDRMVSRFRFIVNSKSFLSSMSIYPLPNKI